MQHLGLAFLRARQQEQVHGRGEENGGQHGLVGDGVAEPFGGPQRVGAQDPREREREHARADVREVGGEERVRAARHGDRVREGCEGGGVSED